MGKMLDRRGMAIDRKLFEQFGFEKVKENEYGVYYERYDEKYKFTQVVCIISKASGKHLIQSYDKTTLNVCESDATKPVKCVNEGCGIECAMIPLINKKILYMKKKYNWN